MKLYDHTRDGMIECDRGKYITLAEHARLASRRMERIGLWKTHFGRLLSSRDVREKVVFLLRRHSADWLYESQRHGSPPDAGRAAMLHDLAETIEELNRAHIDEEVGE